MDKLYHTLSFIFIHVLFLIVEIGLVVSIYVAAADKDRSVLFISGLLIGARSCLKAMWEAAKIDYTIDQEGISDE